MLKKKKFQKCSETKKIGSQKENWLWASSYVEVCWRKKLWASSYVDNFQTIFFTLSSKCIISSEHV